ncbi:hypothetical protein EZJ19_05755 [Parasulfuritortus cantonensis]|uniref:Uncharacterized protein n=1 Tax=Parasulfuritortus cantonensis TaxID=2528202 RepID=A0A4R1BFX1_9PROT|nr:hypothetical protein [Parasulfuritortus cantonensis]TCJ16095.1 hypothetical protein EZJ19_05755 [Parasulfuritortus cantonensis]
MWVFLNNAFLSVVSKGPDPDKLCVRTRVKGDIERVFPGFDVIAKAGTDYSYRAFIPRDVVANRLAGLATGLDYSNFKNSVHEPVRHDAYMRVWEVMYDYQMEAKRPERGGNHDRK